MHNEVIWIVKDGQRVQVGACPGSWSTRQTSQIIAPSPHSYVECHDCRRTLQGSSHLHNDSTICRRGARNPWREKLQNHQQHLDVNWPVMFNEQALVRSQAREQGRRLHDEKNKIDGKLAQVDLSSCTEKLFLSHDHNQQTSSCTSVRCMREYSRWKHPL